MEEPSAVVAPSSNPDSDTLAELYFLETSAATTLNPTEDFRCSPVQSTRHRQQPNTDSPAKFLPSGSSNSLSSLLHSKSPAKEEAPEMTFSSSPVLYPQSSSPPPALPKKRKLFQTLSAQPAPKKSKIIGGFLEGKEDDSQNDPLPQRDGEEVLKSPERAPERFYKELEPGIDRLEYSPKDQRRASSPSIPPAPRLLLRRLPAKGVHVQTSSGKGLKVPLRTRSKGEIYEQVIAQRSSAAPGRAKKAYYGIEIHKLIDDARTKRELYESQEEFKKQNATTKSVERPTSRASDSGKKVLHQLWTEKYRAKKFTELVGDERTHRLVLRWLKGWDEVVFPGTKRSKPKRIYDDKNAEQDRQHRKILLLTGPPGLGKTTLAHVCAKQAGYEALEINASDDRSREVVKGRIKDALGTETVRGVKEEGRARKAGRPLCVIVDEVDGVVTGSGGGGEGGFMRALIDLVQLDQRNSAEASKSRSESNQKRKGDKFRLLRPLVLICNDVYAPSLRPLRTSSLAEIVHVRKPALDKLITRLKNVFESEKIPCDNDAARRICEASWGMGTRKQNTLGGRGAGEGDIRGVLVQAEWIAHKFRSSHDFSATPRLNRKWVDRHLEESQSGSSQTGLGRGGVREVIDRIFVEGAGLPNLPTALSAEDARLVADSKGTSIGVADLRKRTAISSLREMIDTCGDHDRVMADCFTTYPTQVFQDDVQLSKPNEGYDWLHFHDCLSSRIFGHQDWELNPYLSTGACGFHSLFAAVDKGDRSWNDERKDEEETNTHPFGGLKADFAAYEAEKQNRTLLTELQSSFAAPLLRLFSSVDTMAMELIPCVGRMLSPDVKPVVVGGSGGSASIASVRKESEKACIQNAVRVMSALEVRFENVKVEAESAHSRGGFVYRMEPPLDTLTAFQMDKSTTAQPAPVRYAVRQVLDQELRKEQLLLSSMARQARSSVLAGTQVDDDDKENEPSSKAKVGVDMSQSAKAVPVKRDFFGRIINEARPASAGKSANEARNGERDDGRRIWVSFHEGFSNAVRKPITLKELMDSF